VSSSTSPQTGKLTHPLEIIQSGNLVMDEMRKLGRVRRLFLKPTRGKVKEADDALRSEIAALDAGYLPPQGGVAGFAERVFAWEELLTPFIEKLKPKAVFMPCYFCDQQTLGLTAACHKAGVPVIDIQHGGQDNPMYYGWQGAAAESPYLADYFWMWSDYFTEFTAANNSGAKGVPFTGGNFWMQKSLSSIPVTEPVAALRAESANVARTVVVSLQLGLPEHLHEAIKRLPGNWRWLLRFHPRQPETERQLVKQMVAGMPNVETERPTNVNLFHLLQLADVHITSWSTVAVEALQLGVPTVFVHKNAEAGFGRLIGKHGFLLETTTEGLMKALAEAQKVKAMHILRNDEEIRFPDALLNALNAASK
ncbi:MAG: hypothetical protein ACRC3B_09145, partial [Bacteroidia bacterium]